jgi:hypothetical protein
MADDKFKLPGTSFDELMRIISAYATLDRAASPADVGGIAGKHETAVSRNNAFLAAMGIIEGGARGKRVTDEGKLLGLAYEHNQLNEISARWRSLCSRNEFTLKVLSAVRVRRGMDRPTLISHVAYTAGQAKTKATMAGASCLVDILIVASLLHEQNGKLTAEPTSSAPPPTVDEEARVGTVVVEGEPDQSIYGFNVSPALRYTTTAGFGTLGATPLSTYTRVPFEIQLRLLVQCTPDEIPSLAAKIRQLIHDLETPPPEPGSAE